MMKVWLIWVQGDDATWLEAAWEDEMTAENRSGYDAELDRIEKMCHDNPGYAMRIQAVLVPGVLELFEIPTVEARPA
jgi:hypothetical protein